jgi:hypothetical protein
VPVDQLLPNDEGPAFVNDDTTRWGADSTVRIDLRKLESLTGPEADMLNRYLTMIQVQRQDFNGRMLTIRRDDLRAIACILGVTVDNAGERLDHLGLKVEVALIEDRARRRRSARLAYIHPVLRALRLLRCDLDRSGPSDRRLRGCRRGTSPRPSPLAKPRGVTSVFFGGGHRRCWPAIARAHPRRYWPGRRGHH